MTWRLTRRHIVERLRDRLWFSRTSQQIKSVREELADLAAEVDELRGRLG
jgi:hypothetical protein